LNANGQRRIRAVVFDFDGTLAELHLDFVEMKQRVKLLAERFFVHSPEPMALTPALEWVEKLCTDVTLINPTACDEFKRRAYALIFDMEMEAARKGRLFGFTRELLSQLQRDGILTAIITRNCEAAVRQVFPDLEGYCSSFLSREHVPQVKPHPDHLLRALQHIETAPDWALMVGDHPIDIQTGRSAGVRTAGVYSGNASGAELLRSGAQWVAGDCLSLIEELRRHCFI
jgi:phosphoglycolate phosphatase